VHVTDCTEYESQSLPRRRIQENYVFVKSQMDTKNTDLLDHLFTEGVLEEEEKMDVDVLPIPSQRCERLLSIMGRKTAKQYEIFVNTLEATNQQHVADVLRLQGSFPFCETRYISQLITALHRVSKTSKIIFVITTSNFHQI